jgi:hypothetical protein
MALGALNIGTADHSAPASSPRSTISVPITAPAFCPLIKSGPGRRTLSRGEVSRGHAPFTTIVVIFLALIACAHVVRAITGAEVIVSGRAIPVWASWLGALLAGFLSYVA